MMRTPRPSYNPPRLDRADNVARAAASLIDHPRLDRLSATTMAAIFSLRPMTAERLIAVAESRISA